MVKILSALTVKTRGRILQLREKRTMVQFGHGRFERQPLSLDDLRNEILNGEFDQLLDLSRHDRLLRDAKGRSPVAYEMNTACKAA